MPSWPATFPQRPDLGGFSGGPRANAIHFAPREGASISRRIGSGDSGSYAFRFSTFTFAQFELFEEWFQTDLYQGALSFTMDHPRSLKTYSWKFTDDDPPYTEDHSLPLNVVVSFRLLRL